MYRARSLARLVGKFKIQSFSNPSIISRSSNAAKSIENISNPSVSSIPHASFLHSSSQKLNASASADAIPNEDMIFPRERVGLDYALNWSLAKIGITPKNEAFKNLDSEELRNHGATKTESIENFPFYTKTQPSSSSTSLSPKQFAKLLKEVKSSISSSSKIFCSDFCLGSAPKFDSKFKLVSDSPNPNLLFSSFLSKISTRKMAEEPHISTIYVSTQFKSDDLGKDGFGVLDLDTSSLILTGNAFADSALIQSALVSLSYSTILAKGGLLLPSLHLIKESSSALVISSSKIFSAAPGLKKNSISKNVCSILTNLGISEPFRSSSPNEPHSNPPNLFRLPSSIVFLLSESSDALPPLLKLSPSQAAYHLLAGYDGYQFDSFLSSFSLPAHLIPSATKLSEILTSTNIPVYIINVNKEGKLLDEKEIEKLIFMTTSDKIPKPKLNKSSEASFQALKEKFEDYMIEKFPDLPAEISL